MSATNLPAPPAYGFPLPPPPPPPGYGFGYRYASLGSRFGAVLIDFLVLLVVTAVLAIPLGLLALFGALTSGPAWWLTTFLAGPFTLLMFIVWIGYFTYFEHTTGQTIGKRSASIRVIDPVTGRPPDLAHSFLRNALRVVDWLPAFYLLGFLVAYGSARKQRIGDLVAETIVVDA